MAHLGIICPSSTGHLNTMFPLGQELQRRGHRVTLFGVLDVQDRTLAAGLEFRALGESEFPPGTTASTFAQLGQLSGLAALRYTVQWVQQRAAIVLRDAPEAMRQAKVEALLVDQIAPEGGTVAECLGIPFITICSAVVLNREETIPPMFTPWSYNPSWWARIRNRSGYALLSRTTKSMWGTIAEYRQRWKLPVFSNPNAYYSPFAQISQQPEEFEFPRTQLPQHFHFTGPYAYSYAACRESVSFPFEKLTGAPLIYASMGTLQNRQQEIFRCIAESCVKLDAQLVISLGNSNATVLSELPSSPLVVSYAPQLELLKRATLTITHAGLNTTLESLSNGVPMVAIPVTNDQPGVGARLARSGAGEVISLKRLSTLKLRAAIQGVLNADSYKKNASRLQQAIHQGGGVRQAIDIIEQVLSTGKPVLR